MLVIGDNIKQLRDSLGLTQQKFADRIGIKQATLSTAESGKSNLSRQALLSISREFGVRLEWLETGEGEMFARRNASIIEQLATEYNLTAQERELIDNFLSLPPDVRELVAAAVSRAAKLYPRHAEPEVRKPDSILNADEAADVVRQERQDMLDAQKRATTTSPVSTGTSGTSKKFGNPIA